MNTINFLKGVIFYSTVIMGCITLGIDLDKTSNDVLFWWFTILCFLGITTWKICSGKTTEEIKEFTGINFVD